MNWYLAMFSQGGIIRAHGWHLAADDMELVAYARDMKYSIDVVYLGAADMRAMLPVVVPGTESAACRAIQAGTWPGLVPL